MKIHKEKTIKKIILVLLIMILGSTLIELGTNIKSLYMKNQNIMKIDEDHIELKGFVKKGKGYYLSNAEGVLRCDLNNKYVKKFVYDFDTGDMVDAEIKVGYDNSMGKEEVMIIEDKNPILLSESVVNVNKKVKWIEISLSSVEGGSGIYIKNIRINNQIEINKYRIFCSSVLILGICVCVIFRKKITKESTFVNGLVISGAFSEEKDALKNILEGIPVFEKYEDLLQKSDAIYLITSPSHHYEDIKLALKMKKHVL